MKKILCLGLFTFIVFNLVGTSVVFAQEAGTLIPETTNSKVECDVLLDKFENEKMFIKNSEGKEVETKDPKVYFATKTDKERNDILACAVITGKIKFWMVPFYVVYLIEFAIGISGLIAILILVVGGFQYVIGGATEKQEQAKNTIQYALLGLVVVLVAWVVVNIVQFMLTI